MPRKKRNQPVEEDPAPADDEAVGDEEEDPSPPKKSRRGGRKAKGRRSSSETAEEAPMGNPNDFPHDDEEEDDIDGGGGSQTMQFSQLAPEATQPLPAVKPTEASNLTRMNKTTRNRIVTDLSRLLLFKALSGEPIDRRKVLSESLGEHKGERVGTAILDAASKRLRDVFGFKLRTVPPYLEKSLPARFKERLYVTNAVEDPDGDHARSVHGGSYHVESSTEKALLMLVLAFAFCKGSPRHSKDGGTRWITASQLYRLLHGVDENVPAEPPAPDVRTKGGAKSKTGRGAASAAVDALTPSPAAAARRGGDDAGGVGQTPDVDANLDRFVHLEYLLRDRFNDNANSSTSSAAAAAAMAASAAAAGGDDGKGEVVYAMGPRAALEIGRRQVVHFCAEALGEQPDPTMLKEIEEDEVEEEEEMVEGEEEMMEGEEGLEVEVEG